jgi:hypothetical protein
MCTHGTQFTTVILSPFATNLESYWNFFATSAFAATNTIGPTFFSSYIGLMLWFVYVCFENLFAITTRFILLFLPVVFRLYFFRFPGTCTFRFFGSCAFRFPGTCAFEAFRFPGTCLFDFLVFQMNVVLSSPTSDAKAMLLDFLN